MPFISICIPAYKNIEFFKKLLDSIAIQTFKDYEVVITDDSPDNDIQFLVEDYKNKIAQIDYYKNKKSLGSPENWNEGIRKANGEWIKIMHTDDFFLHENSLQIFAETATTNSAGMLVFSGYSEFKDGKKYRDYTINSFDKKLLMQSPLNLFKYNFIGHPSTTLIKNNRTDWYDKNIKWVVDFEFYIRYLSVEKFISIPQMLIGIGIHSDQITQQVFRKPEVELPENIYLLNKCGTSALKNIYVYDYYWRLFRNLGIRQFSEIYRYVSEENVPKEIIKMLRFQFKIPLLILKIGVLSKFFMLLNKIIFARK